jgi:hypothetical protein
MIMNIDFAKKDFLPVYCERCRKQGYIFLDDFGQPAFIVCSCCGSEMSQEWCPKCGQRGDFIKIVETRPSSWNCPKCKTRYFLPPFFYENVVHLYLEDELPQDVRLRVDPPEDPSNKIKRYLVFGIGIGGILALIIMRAMGISLFLIILVMLVVIVLVLLLLKYWDFGLKKQDTGNISNLSKTGH